VRRYSEVVKVDVRRRMSLLHRQSLSQISAELDIHEVTLYNLKKGSRLQGEVAPASEKEPEGWGATDKFTVVLETAGLNATEPRVLPRARSVPIAGGTLAASIQGCPNEKRVLTLKE